MARVGSCHVRHLDPHAQVWVISVCGCGRWISGALEMQDEPWLGACGVKHG